MIDADTIRTWRINYGLCRRTPAEAAQWWETKVGSTPSGAVAALGTCIEEVERQAAQIERMRAALAEARRVLDEDRMALLDCHTDHTGRVDDDGRSAATVYDTALRMIDEAMGET